MLLQGGRLSTCRVIVCVNEERVQKMGKAIAQDTVACLLELSLSAS